MVSYASAIAVAAHVSLLFITSYAAPPPGFPAQGWQADGQPPTCDYRQQSGYGAQPGFHDGMGPYFGPANQSARPWPPRHDLQPQQPQQAAAFAPHQLQLQQYGPQQPPLQQQPQQTLPVGFGQSQFQTGPQAPQYGRLDLPGPFNNAHGPPQSWNPVPGLAPDESLQSHAGQVRPDALTVPRRNAQGPDDVSRPVNPSRGHRDVRSSRRPVDVPRHATPPRRERIRDAVGRSSDHRVQVRAAPPRPDVALRQTRSNRNSSDETRYV